MKNLVFAIVAVLGVSVGSAYAQGVPPGYQGTAYGPHASANFHNATSDQGGGSSAKGG
jgi:hypothetical protein